MNTVKTILSTIALLAVGVLVGWCCRGVKPPQTEFVTLTDTLTIRDTVTDRMPVHVADTRVDTMLVPVRDTVIVHDTAYVLVEREQLHYHADNYDAWVSGWRPALDSIWVYPETRYITAESIPVTSRKRWGIGIQAGYGVGVSSGRIRTFPYIGVGISYDLVRW